MSQAQPTQLTKEQLYQQHSIQYQNALIDIKNGKLDRSDLITSLLAPAFNYWKNNSLIVKACYGDVADIASASTISAKTKLLTLINTMILKMVPKYDLKDSFEKANEYNQGIVDSLFELDVAFMNMLYTFPMKAKVSGDLKTLLDTLTQKSFIVCFADDKTCSAIATAQADSQEEFFDPSPNHALLTQMGVLGNIVVNDLAPKIQLSLNSTEQHTSHKRGIMLVTDALLLDSCKFTMPEILMLTKDFRYNYDLVFNEDQNKIYGSFSLPNNNLAVGTFELFNLI